MKYDRNCYEGREVPLLTETAECDLFQDAMAEVKRYRIPLRQTIIREDCRANEHGG
jgi:hypothetical protein